MKDELMGYRVRERAEVTGAGQVGLSDRETPVVGFGESEPKSLRQQEKHERLWEAVRRVEAVQERLSQLADRIGGVNESSEVNGRDTPGSLAAALVAAPEVLGEVTERMHKQIAEIEEMLFG